MTRDEEQEAADKLTVQLRLFGLSKYSCYVSADLKRDRRYWIFRKWWSGGETFVVEYFTTLQEMEQWVHKQIDAVQTIRDRFG